jgi:hypothetical protein
MDAYEQKYQERALENLKAYTLRFSVALALGFDLVPSTLAPEGVS